MVGFIEEITMDRFKPFFGLTLNRKAMDEPFLLETTGLSPRYLPDAFDDLDEFDYLLPFEGDKKLVFSAVVEMGKLKRVIFGWVGPEDDEDELRPLTPDELKRGLDLQGRQVAMFLEAITS